MARKSGGSNAWHGHFEPKRVPEGVWMRCDGCQAHALPQAGRARTSTSAPSATTTSPSRPSSGSRSSSTPTRSRSGIADLRPGDPLGFNDRRPYPERVKAEQERTGLNEAAVVGQGFIKGIRIVFGLTDSGFIMGSMGSVVGEKLTRAIEEATRQKLPLVIVSRLGRRRPDARGDLLADADGQGLRRPGPAPRGRRPLHQRPDPPDDGGRRRQLRLARRHHPRRAQGPDRLRRPEGHRSRPSASSSPPGFQTSEFLLEHGFVDRIVHRRDLRSMIAQLIDYTMP